MKGYLSIREVSYKWGVSERRVNQYVTQGRIPGAPGTGVRGQTEASEDTAAEASSGQITFSDLKDYYAALTDAYNAVVNAYNNDAIAQSDEIDKNLADAKDLMDQMGELSKTDFKSREDLETEYGVKRVYGG